MTATNSIAGASSYDQVPYGDSPQRTTHPRHLETVATLFGMSPQNVTRCSVLELGCAAGSNLIAQAFDLPESKFLGLDFSEVQIAAGQKMIEALGLKNIELRHADIMEVDHTLGQFDYITCHGVYSWTPTEIQDRIMDISKANLAPHGVAFISYNVNPGWHFRATVREMMLYHVSHIKDPQEQIEQARAILEFLASSSEAGSVRARLLEDELESVRQSSDAYLFHEHLEADNRPIYFHEFAARAKANGLQYLGESEFCSMFDRSLPPSARETLDAMGDLPLVRREQYMDFVRNREYRATLLCHDEIALDRDLKPGILEKFHLVTIAAFERTFDINSNEEVRISIGDGELRTAHPLIKAAIAHLNDHWPAAYSLQDLHTAAIDRLQHRQTIDEDCLRREFLGLWMLSALIGGTVEVSVHPPGRFATDLSHRPLASGLAREQAARGEGVTNLRNGFTKLDTLARFVIRLLDGEHDREDILRAVSDAVRSGSLTLDRTESQLIDSESLSKLVDDILSQIYKAPLLVS